MKNPSVASPEYWNSLYECLEEYLEYEPNAMLFTDLFKRFIKQGGTCIEIGCYPGNNLLYFAKEFGYSISGIDITSRIYTKMQKYFDTNGVIPEELICEDFLTFKPTKTYDLVLSFGFVEHFKNLEENIIKHIQMVSPGGYLIITAPNLTRLQYIIHLILDRKPLSEHVISTMSLRKWRRILEANHMRLHHHSYYKTVGFVRGPDKPETRFKEWSIRKVTSFFNKIDKHISLPNPLLSPWMISISQRSR